jgi:hypothetical protein
MSEITPIEIEMSGGCQCRAIRFHVTNFVANPHICHCRMCQKATGQLFAASAAVLDENLTWTRGTPAVFESSDYVERGFCRDCGTPLFFHLKDATYRAISIGAFDDPAGIPLHFQVGSEGKHPGFDGIASLADLGPTEGIDAAGAARIAASNHQHPDHDTEAWPPAS